MAASRMDISLWFDNPWLKDARYMVVLCDSFDHEDYPSYCVTREEALERIAYPGEMQRVMEVYDLQADKEVQLNTPRCWSI